MDHLPMNDVKKGDVEDEDMVLPGFRFYPTDEELVGFYLRGKVEKKKALPIEIIKEMDIYKHDPWYLSKLINTVGVVDKEHCYYFCLRERKYRNSDRPNRVTGSGYWKATGIDKKIINPSRGNDCIGLKKSLVYYLGSSGRGSKTDWMMHEFRLPPEGTAKPNNNNNAAANDDKAHEAENWTLCRIFKRNSTTPNKFPQQVWEDSTAKQRTLLDHSSPSSCIIDSIGNIGDLNCQPQFATSQVQQTHGEDPAVKPSWLQQEQYQQYHREDPRNSTAMLVDIPLENSGVISDSRFVFLSAYDGLIQDPNWDERISEYNIDLATVYDY